MKCKTLARIVLAVVVYAMAGVFPRLDAFGAGSPQGDAAAAWPAAWSTYRTTEGAAIFDVNGDQNPDILDLASGTCTGANCTGTEPTVLWASDGTNAFFRMRMAVNGWDATKGGLSGGAYLVQLRSGGNVVAVVGVDGKSSSADEVYVTDSIGGVVTPVYTWPFNTSGGQNSAGLRTVSADGGQYYLDFQVPIARITAVNPAVTSTSPLQLYYGSSAAANLATINKDLMRGAGTTISWDGLSEITFSASALSAARTRTTVSGPNPPVTGTTTTYDIPLTLTNTGGADVDAAAFTASVPAGVTVVSVSTAKGTITSGASGISWAAGSLVGGATATATVRVSITPADGTGGTTPALLTALAATGTDRTSGAARTATAADVTADAVVQANRPPVVGADSLTVAEDGSGAVTVLTNDSDPDGDALTVTVHGAPAHGTAVVNGDRTITYTPAPNDHGTDSFTYQACDPSNACTTGTVSVTVTPVNDAPVAQDGSVSTGRNKAVSGQAPATDVDGDTLTFAKVVGPVNGTATVSTNGAFTYTPAAGYTGPDSFTFEVCDPSEVCREATISVTVTPAAKPIANDDTTSVDEDSSVIVAVLTNDVDVEGDGLTPELVGLPAHGKATVGSDGRITYTPAANVHGTDSFTYRVCDPFSVCSTAATVSITIDPVNDAPVADDDTTTVSEDGSIVVDVLANDDDVDGDDLTAEVTVQPEHGKATVGSDGRITYTPAANFHGTDSFTYEACDADGECATATVTVTITAVNDAPAAAALAVSTDEDTPHTGQLPATDLDGDTLTFAVEDKPANGTVVVNADGTFTYTPAANFHGTDTFTYEACDADEKCSTATVTVTVGAVNDEPAAADLAVSTDEDTPHTGQLPAADVDGDSLTFTVATNPANGTVVVNPDGTFTYTPAANFHGTDTFTYEACDADEKCSTATVTVTVGAVNDAPAAEDDTADATEDGSVVIDVLANDDDVDGDDLTAEVTIPPEHGIATVGSDGRITYTPAAAFHGTDTFTYEACDPDGECRTAQVTITVAAVDEDPAPADPTPEDEDDDPAAEEPVTPVAPTAPAVPAAPLAPVTEATTATRAADDLVTPAAAPTAASSADTVAAPAAAAGASAGDALARRAELPRTGASGLSTLALVGLGTMALGLALSLASRMRRPAAAPARRSG